MTFQNVFNGSSGTREKLLKEPQITRRGRRTMAVRVRRSRITMKNRRESTNYGVKLFNSRQRVYFPVSLTTCVLIICPVPRPIHVVINERWHGRTHTSRGIIDTTIRVVVYVISRDIILYVTEITYTRSFAIETEQILTQTRTP